MVAETSIYIWVSLWLFFVFISRHSGTSYHIWLEGCWESIGFGGTLISDKTHVDGNYHRTEIPLGLSLPKASRMGVEFQKPNIEPPWFLLGEAPSWKIGCEIQERSCMYIYIYTHIKNIRIYIYIYYIHSLPSRGKTLGNPEIHCFLLQFVRLLMKVWNDNRRMRDAIHPAAVKRKHMDV